MTSVRDRWVYLERERSAVLVVLFQGILSFLVVPVATGNLSSQDSSTFLIAWSTLNTAVLAVFGPVELMAPAIIDRSGTKRPTAQPNILLINRFYILAGIATALIVPIIVGLLTGDWDIYLLVASAFFVVCYGAFSLFRSRTFGLDQIPRAATQTGLVLVIWLPIVGIQILTGRVSISGLVAAGAIAYGGATLAMVTRSLKVLVKSGELIERDSHPSDIGHFARQYFNVAAAGLATLLMQSIGVLLAAVINAPPAVIVTYAGALVLVRGGFAALTSLATPFSVRYANYRKEGRWNQYLGLFAIHLSILVFTTAMACIAAATIGEEFLEFYTHQPSALGPGLLVLIFLGEGLIVLSIVPRLILVTEGQTRIMSVVFPLGAAISTAIMFIPIDQAVRLSVAPLAGGIFICAVLIPVATKRLLQQQANSSS